MLKGQWVVAIERPTSPDDTRARRFYSTQADAAVSTCPSPGSFAIASAMSWSSTCGCRGVSSRARCDRESSGLSSRAHSGGVARWPACGAGREASSRVLHPTPASGRIPPVWTSGAQKLTTSSTSRRWTVRSGVRIRHGEFIPDGEHVWRIWVEHTLVYCTEEPGQSSALSWPSPAWTGASACTRCSSPHQHGDVGVASRLMEPLLAEMDRRNTAVFLTVDPANEKALRLYLKLGFTDRSALPEYYRATEDRLLLTRRPQ